MQNCRDTHNCGGALPYSFSLGEPMRVVHKFGAALLLLLASLLSAAGSYPQGGAAGDIACSVLYTTGAAISAAEVQIVNTGTESLARKLSTNADGEFVAPLLPPGTYQVVVNKSGFGEAKAEDIEVRVTETTRVTITMRPAAVSETLQISAQVTRVKTTNTTTSTPLATTPPPKLPLPPPYNNH